MKFKVVNVIGDDRNISPFICSNVEEVEEIRRKYWPENTVIDTALNVPEIKIQTNSGILVIRDGNINGSVDVSFVGNKSHEETYIGSVGRTCTATAEVVE